MVHYEIKLLGIAIMGKGKNQINSNSISSSKYLVTKIKLIL